MVPLSIPAGYRLPHGTKRLSSFLGRIRQKLSPTDLFEWIKSGEFLVEKLSSASELTQNQTKETPHLITVIPASSSRCRMVNAAVVRLTPVTIHFQGMHSHHVSLM